MILVARNWQFLTKKCKSPDETPPQGRISGGRLSVQEKCVSVNCKIVRRPPQESTAYFISFAMLERLEQ